MAFITPYDAPAFVKKMGKHEQLKVIEWQQLQLIEDGYGGIEEMILKSKPCIFVPWIGNVKMGDMEFNVKYEEGVDGCVVGLCSDST